VRNEAHGRFLPAVQDVKDTLVLICGHGGRDERCGIMGPLLREQFEVQLPRDGFQVAKGPVDIDLSGKEVEMMEKDVGNGRGTVRVGLISHIGGHKFAGNVILYMPPGATTSEGNQNPLAGCGIWYGRVEPKHVEGIVRETLLGGRVIEELFRGGIQRDGEIMRL